LQGRRGDVLGVAVHHVGVFPEFRLARAFILKGQKTVDSSSPALNLKP